MAHLASPGLWIATASFALGACGGPPEVDVVRSPLDVAAEPPGHTFEGMTTVELMASRPARIFYTLDGGDPIDADAQVYEGPLGLDHSTLVTFIAEDDDGVWSPPRSELYVPAEVPAETNRVPTRGLRLDRTSYFFAPRSAAEGRVTAEFTVRSVGLRPANVEAVYITANPSGGGSYEPGIFTLEQSEAATGALAPGEERTFVVAYTPTTTIRGAALVIVSDDRSSSDGVLVADLWGRIMVW
ncbi:chitobiase/beta-hexosaminidase C-terminal domain-containing protein [Myxococcota bacterium]|nr:chitobiase/beta-hexosaminidase C-terminal domain-containing protein [Myxococcota bacterium]